MHQDPRWCFQFFKNSHALPRISHVTGQTLTMNVYLVGYNAALCAGWYVAVAIVRCVDRLV